MLQQGSLLRTDPFGVENPPRPWIAYEWLFEIGSAALVKAGGLPLVYAVGFLLFALVPVVLWRTLLRQQISLPVAFLYVLTASLFFRVHLLLRPPILTYLFLAIIVGLWRCYGNTPKRWLWLILPVIFAVWANIHGGFVAGLLFLTLSWVGHLCDRLSTRQHPIDNATLSWLAILIISINATLLTPHGLALHRLIWDMVFHIKSFSQWNEFRPPDFAQPSLLAIPILFIAGVLLISRCLNEKSRLTWETALPLLLFLYFGVKVQRHVLLLLIVAAVPVCRDLDAWLEVFLCEGTRQRLFAYTEIERRNTSYVWIIPVAALFSTLIFIRTSGAHNLRVGYQNVSPEAVNFIRDHRDQFQRPLVTTWTAGALVYHLAPDFRVTYDDRTEFFGDARLKPYIALLQTQPGWQQTLTHDDFDSAILDHDFSITDALRQLPGWQLVYEDELNAIFVRGTLKPTQNSSPVTVTTTTPPVDDKSKAKAQKTKPQHK